MVITLLIWRERCNSDLKRVCEIRSQNRNSSPSLLDHFYTNQISKVKHIGLLINDTTDHLPIIATISMHTKVHKNQLSSHIRDFRNFNIDRFNDDLGKFNDDESENLDTRFQKFHNHLQSCVNSNLPLRKRTKKEIKFAHKPWISNGLKYQFMKETVYIDCHE